MEPAEKSVIQLRIEFENAVAINKQNNEAAREALKIANQSMQRVRELRAIYQAAIEKRIAELKLANKL